MRMYIAVGRFGRIVFSLFIYIIIIIIRFRRRRRRRFQCGV